MTKPTILLDVDGVLVEHNWENLDRVNAEFGTNYRFEDIDTFAYDFMDAYDFMEPEHRQFLYDECWHDPTLYDDNDLGLVEITTIETLRDVGRVIACSSPLVGHIESKYRFLKRYFDRADIALVSDKNLISGDILVDDGPHNTERFPGYSIIFDRPWNQDAVADARAHGFDDVAALVIDYVANLGSDEPVKAENVVGDVNRRARQALEETEER